MSAVVYPKKRFPLSLSLGITTKLSTTETHYDEMFRSLSFETKKTLVSTTNSLAIITQGSNKNRQNDLLVFLAVRRALGLKNKSKFPVVFVIKSQSVGKEVIEELARYSTDAKVYNLIFGLKDKLPKELETNDPTQADFLLTTYQTLRDVVLKNALPITEQILFINPLTKVNCHREALVLDDIIHGLNKHKCKRHRFTYFLDAQSFPVLETNDYRHLLNVDECLFFGCKAKSLDMYNTKLYALEQLHDEHYWFFVLRELFRKRNNLTGLETRFQSTLTYKLHLYSHSLTPKILAEKNKENSLFPREREY